MGAAAQGVGEGDHEGAIFAGQGAAGGVEAQLHRRAVDDLEQLDGGARLGTPGEAQARRLAGDAVGAVGAEVVGGQQGQAQRRIGSGGVEAVADDADAGGVLGAELVLDGVADHAIEGGRDLARAIEQGGGGLESELTGAAEHQGAFGELQLGGLGLGAGGAAHQREAQLVALVRVLDAAGQADDAAGADHLEAHGGSVRRVVHALHLEVELHRHVAAGGADHELGDVADGLALGERQALLVRREHESPAGGLGHGAVLGEDGTRQHCRGAEQIGVRDDRRTGSLHVADGKLGELDGHDAPCA